MDDGSPGVVEEHHLKRLPALAAELDALKVDVIVTGNTTVAAKQATTTIPIVFAAVAAVGAGAS